MAKATTDPIDLAIASAAALAFVILAKKRLQTKLEEEQRVMRDYLQLQSDAEDYYMNYQVNVLHPQKILALEWAQALELPVHNPQQYYESLYYESREVFDSAERAHEKMTFGSCHECSPDCDNEFQIEANIASANDAYAHKKQNENRMLKRLKDED